MNNTCAVMAIAAGVLAAPGPAQAQETGKVMIDVAECIELEAPEARLECYESRVAAIFGERAARAAAARPAPPASAAAPAASATPTRSPASTAPAVSEPVQSRGDRQSRREEKEQAAEVPAAKEIVSRVKELHETVPNAYLITLENGQVWRQTLSKQYSLRPGQQVRIYGTRWGMASRLSADEINGYIQVERVR